MVNRPPKVKHLTVDLHVHLIQMPSPMGKIPHVTDPLAPDFSSEHRPESVPPEPHRFVANIHPAFEQQILDVTKLKWVLHVNQHHQTDDLRR